jgi:hypothetical protein
MNDSRMLPTLAWRSLLCAALMGAPRALAQDSGPAPIELSPHIAARIHWIQYHMLSGRVVATSPMVVPRMNVRSTSSQRGGRREDLTLEISAGLPGLRYDMTGADERLQIALVGGNQLSIQHSHATEQRTFSYEQRAEGAVLMSLEEVGVKRTWQAGGVWQLFIAQPDVVRRRLVPILEILRPSWQLAATAAQIEEALIERPPAVEQPDQTRWAVLIRDLASPKFSERQNAQRELYKAGQMVVPFLQKLDRDRLDAEQAYRIRSLIESLTVDYEDKVERVVAALATDEQTWLALLARQNLPTRQVAAGQLELLLDGPIDFDPQASDQDRAAQLERLTARLEKPAATEKHER